MEQQSSSNDSNSMDISSSTIVTQVESNNNNNNNTISNIKRKNIHNESSSINKRSKLSDMIFYDGNRHPAAVLHDLRPEISSDKYSFQSEEISPRQIRFRCSVTIEQKDSESIIAIGVGRSKQLAKNMAAQVILLFNKKFI